MTRLIERNTTIPTQQEPGVLDRGRQPAAGRDPRAAGRARDGARQHARSARFILDGIPPAPRGVPQIEVTFDIDANGILNVSAKDKATEQRAVDHASRPPGSRKEEIERMVARSRGARRRGPPAPRADRDAQPGRQPGQQAEKSCARTATRSPAGPKDGGRGQDRGRAHGSRRARTSRPCGRSTSELTESLQRVAAQGLPGRRDARLRRATAPRSRGGRGLGRAARARPPTTRRPSRASSRRSSQGWRERRDAADADGAPSRDSGPVAAAGGVRRPHRPDTAVRCAPPASRSGRHLATSLGQGPLRRCSRAAPRDRRHRPQRGAVPGGVARLPRARSACDHVFLYDNGSDDDLDASRRAPRQPRAADARPLAAAGRAARRLFARPALLRPVGRLARVHRRGRVPRAARRRRPARVARRASRTRPTSASREWTSGSRAIAARLRA